MRAIVIALALAGCEEPLGPMSPETVDAITKTTGDATGFDRSGQYWVWIDPVDCPCSEASSAPEPRPWDAGLAALSLCEILDQNSPEDPSLFDVLATDGVVTFESHETNYWAVLVGPLYEGGRFSAGSVTSIATLGAGGRMVTRVDGDFDSSNGGQEFEATLRNRIAGKTTIEAQAFDVDCTEELELRGMFP